MNETNVVRMANQIAEYFSAYPEEEALAGISGHISQFWEPRLRKTLAALVRKGEPGLDPLVIAATKELAAE
ncbi:MAG: formate dehydrogenase subunit delta [Alphaproteobacteria bacterium]|nr:formate dehydrogenase subunit delta [Alphaproteobacteria bacterium]